MKIILSCCSSFFLWILLSTLISGCFYKIPEPLVKKSPDFPKNWTNNHLGESVSGGWLPLEHRTLLLQLIDEGIQNNQQLKVQAARVDIAVKNSLIAGADAMPELSAFLQGGRQRSKSTQNSFGMGLDFGWELDLLGKLDDRERAALFDAALSVENWRKARLTLIADITGQWFTLLENYQQLALIQKREQNLRKNLQIIEEGYKMGLSPSLDLHLARADFAAIRAKVFARQQEMRKQTRKMEYLLGRYPETELLAAGTLPREMAEIPAGIPADILTRRPDILAAGNTLAAANLRVAEAYKNRFPSLQLTGRYGTSTDTLSQLITGESVIWSLFAGLTTPLLNGGRLAALQEKSMARASEAAALYTDTVLLAFVEVENSLEAEQRLKEQQHLLEQASDDSFQAETLAFEQYQNGLVNYITVLESERRAFDAQSTVLAICNERMQNRIRLYLALGGDFPPTGSEPQFFNLP
jgi:NodT family efflux transporter outer membrane factor (OMF) lipoprotein